MKNKKRKPLKASTKNYLITAGTIILIFLLSLFWLNGEPTRGLAIFLRTTMGILGLIGFHQFFIGGINEHYGK